MNSNPSDHLHTPSKQCRSWDGLILEYSQALTDFHDVAISCMIAKELSLQQGISTVATSNLNLMLALSWLDPSLVQQIQPVSLPLNYQWTVTDPSFLHLIQLLQAEIHSPKLMSQQFVGSIVTVLVTHLFRHRQAEQCKH